MNELRVRSIEEAEQHIESLTVNVKQLQDRVRRVEKMLDVWDSPWWKRALFVIDGWPLHRLAVRPQWRPWRKWWTS